MPSYRISQTSLNLFLECPRCFWLKIKNNLKRPEIPSSTLPLGMDNLIKKYFDKHRPSFPPEIKDNAPGVIIPDQELLNKWRNWRIGLKHIYKNLDNSVLTGAIDECFVKEDIYMPADYKTRGVGVKEDSTTYFQNQLNCYTLLLKKNGYKINNKGYLIYYILENVEENGVCKFKIDVIEMRTYPEDAQEAFKKAVEVLNNPLPPLNPECNFCNWVENQKER